MHWVPVEACASVALRCAAQGLACRSLHADCRCQSLPACYFTWGLWSLWCLLHVTEFTAPAASAGASQPHKHVQVVPLPLDGGSSSSSSSSDGSTASSNACVEPARPPVWPAVAEATDGVPAGQPVELRNLPFAAFAARLAPPDAALRGGRGAQGAQPAGAAAGASSQPDGVASAASAAQAAEVGQYLEAVYRQLLASCKAFVQRMEGVAAASPHDGTLSYNMGGCGGEGRQAWDAVGPEACSHDTQAGGAGSSAAAAERAERAPAALAGEDRQARWARPRRGLSSCRDAVGSGGSRVRGSLSVAPENALAVLHPPAWAPAVCTSDFMMLVPRQRESDGPVRCADPCHAGHRRRFAAGDANCGHAPRWALQLAAGRCGWGPLPAWPPTDFNCWRVQTPRPHRVPSAAPRSLAQLAPAPACPPPCSCNSVAFGGSMFVRSTEEVQYVAQRGPLRILAATGYEW